MIEVPEVDGVLIYSPPSGRVEDHRGVYRELWNEDMEPIVPLEVDVSCNRRGVLRGIHGDFETGKLITCIHGAFYLVVLDMRPLSPTYEDWIGVTLSEANALSVWVPPGCGNGHYVLSEWAIFHYIQSRRYTGAEQQFTVKYNEPRYNISWPFTTPPITSERDGPV